MLERAVENQRFGICCLRDENRVWCQIIHRAAGHVFVAKPSRPAAIMTPQISDFPLKFISCCVAHVFILDSEQ